MQVDTGSILICSVGRVNATASFESTVTVVKPLLSTTTVGPVQPVPGFASWMMSQYVPAGRPVRTWICLSAVPLLNAAQALKAMTLASSV